MLSIQRQIGTKALATVSYVGNQGHHLLVMTQSNLGNPALMPGSQPAERSSAWQRHLRTVR